MTEADTRSILRRRVDALVVWLLYAGCRRDVDYYYITGGIKLNRASGMPWREALLGAPNPRAEREETP